MFITCYERYTNEIRKWKDLASEDFMFLVDRIAENDILHLKACLMELDRKKKASLRIFFYSLPFFIFKNF